MKTLHYTRAHDLAQLADELMAALPALRPLVDPGGALDPFGQPQRVPQCRIEGRGADVWLTVPDAVDEAAVVAVVAAHDPAAQSATEAAAAERAAAAGDLTAQYVAALARLDAIIATGGTYTAAQVRDATVDLARIVRRLLRLLKAQVG